MSASEPAVHDEDEEEVLARRIEESAVTMMPCAGATSSVTLGGTGTYTFTADKTYAKAVTVDASGTVTLPNACLEGITDCATLNVLDGTANGLSVGQMCTGDASQSCTCVLGEAGTVAEAGTYATVGHDLTTTTVAGMSTTRGYCVSSSSLGRGSRSRKMWIHSRRERARSPRAAVFARW
jgi:hypothetical protein